MQNAIIFYIVFSKLGKYWDMIRKPCSVKLFKAIRDGHLPLHKSASQLRKVAEYLIQLPAIISNDLIITWLALACPPQSALTAKHSEVQQWAQSLPFAIHGLRNAC